MSFVVIPFFISLLIWLTIFSRATSDAPAFASDAESFRTSNSCRVPSVFTTKIFSITLLYHHQAISRHHISPMIALARRSAAFQMKLRYDRVLMSLCNFGAVRDSAYAQDTLCLFPAYPTPNCNL